MFKFIRGLPSSVPRPLLYTTKVIWFTLVILTILYLAKRDSLKFAYWGGDPNPKPIINILDNKNIFP
jgi:hypothetical protein